MPAKVGALDKGHFGRRPLLVARQIVKVAVRAGSQFDPAALLFLLPESMQVCSQIDQTTSE